MSHFTHKAWQYREAVVETHGASGCKLHKSDHFKSSSFIVFIVYESQIVHGWLNAAP